VFFRPRSSGAGVGLRRDHPLCVRCWRGAVSSEVAREMAAARMRRLAYVAGPFALV
jgi:hypothetical protein